MQVPEAVYKLQQIISPVYLVGGPVRDLLMGNEPQDLDFTTPLLPDEIEDRIRKTGLKPYVVGKRFGTIGVKLEGRMVEVTTFRSETYQAGSRKPEVEFVHNLHHDLSRRDFTINAMALREERLIDTFGGQQDLRNKIIRAVGKPADRFREDPLRMLRAARFAAQLDFTVDPEALEAMYKRRFTIAEVSPERWVQELDKILLAHYPAKGLAILAETKVLNFMIPELAIQVGYDQNSPYHAHDLWEHTKRVVGYAPPDIYMRWACLLHDVGKPFTRTDKSDRSNYICHELVSAQLTWKIGKYLRWSNERLDKVVALVGQHMQADSPLKPYDAQATR